MAVYCFPDPMTGEGCTRGWLSVDLTSSTITFTLLFQHLQTEDMEKAEKLRPAQSLPFLCHSPRGIPEHEAVPLRKSVSVSELVARWVAILQLQMTIDLWSSPGWTLLPPYP